MEIDKWILGYKVRSFPWIDKKSVYLNVQYYAPGQAISKPPVWDKTVYITDNVAGQNMIEQYIDTLVEYVSKMKIPKDYKVVITV